jgi:translation initiation factor IF-2
LSKQDSTDNKDKLRVYEYAKQLNMSSKEVITILKRMNMPVNNHMSVMENGMTGAVEKFFRDVKANAAAKMAQTSTKPAADRRPQTGAPASSSSPAPSAEQQPAKPAATPAPAAAAPAPSAPAAPTAPVAPTPAASAPATAAPAAAAQTDSAQAAPAAPTAPTQTPSTTSSQSQAPRPQGQGSYSQRDGGNRPQGQGSNRPQGQGSSRPQGTGGGYSSGGQSRPQGQGGGYSSGGQSRPQGTGGGYSSGGQSRPQGQGGGYSSGGQSRPQGQGGGYSSGGQSRPQGQGGGYSSGGQSRPQGQGGGYSSGGQSRPQGQGSGYSSGGQSRPQGQGGGYSSGGQSRPQGQGGGYSSGGQSRPQGQSGGFSSAAPSRPGQGIGAGRSPAPTSAGARGGRPGGPAGRGDAKGRTEGEFNRTGAGAGVGAAGKRKETNSRFDDRGGFRGKGKGGKNNRKSNLPPREKIDNTPKKVIVRGSMTVGELAKLLHKDASEVIKKLLLMGVMATINQDLDLDTVLLVVNDYGIESEVKIVVEDTQFETIEENDNPDDLIARPPVVTIMGHVDHGKTTLLDAIRSTKVAIGEAGGITQHIGAYQVEINSKKITFLDTPGHEAFTTMRSRGAQVTDITILVVAADDGVMPQTIEAINHAKAAEVPIIVAVNKIDKPGANPEKVMQELNQYGLVQEAWGGDTIFVNVSAKQQTNLDGLLEMILLVAEVNDYKANSNKRARGTVMEAELDKGKGPIARILVQNGTLKVGDAFVAGDCFGRIRAMTNDRGRRIKEAGPSTPVEITGLTEVPQAGDPFMVFEDERKAREIADKRSIKTRLSQVKANQAVTLEDLFSKIKEGDIKDLNVILKADVQGTLEALKGSLEKIEVEGVRVKTIHSGVGAVTESDIILASASSAIVVGFNVRPEPRAQSTAEEEKVDVRLHSIIYKVIEEIEYAMKGMLDPIFKEKVTGHAEVRETFKVTKVGTIAGCMITDGKIARNSETRLIRGGIVVYTGKLDSLKRFKDDAKEVSEGYECGITLDKFNDLRQGDIIEAFVMETVER